MDRHDERRREIIEEFRRQRETREAAIREVERQTLTNFAHIGEATEEEIADQAEHDLAEREADAEWAARQVEEELENETEAVDYTRRVQEDMQRVIQELHEEEVEAERQQTLTEQLRAQVTQPEVPQPRTMQAHMNLQEGAITFNPTPEQADEIVRAINQDGPGFVQPVDIPQRAPFVVEGHLHNARIENIEAGAITHGVVAARQWEPATFTPPRMYKVDFNKVNSMQDIIKVLKSFYQNYTINEGKVKELEMEHLVDRVDDRQGWI